MLTIENLTMKNRDEIILAKERVFIYNIPFNINQKPELCHRASDWDLSHPVRVCKLTVTAAGPCCYIQLKNTDDHVFGRSQIEYFPDEFGWPSALSAVTDSTRYYSLKIRKSSGEYDVIGIGFSTHKDSSDLAKTLENYFISINPIVEEMTALDPILKHIPDSKSEPEPNASGRKLVENCESESSKSLTYNNNSVQECKKNTLSLTSHSQMFGTKVRGQSELRKIPPSSNIDIGSDKLKERIIVDDLDRDLEAVEPVCKKPKLNKIYCENNLQEFRECFCLSTSPIPQIIEKNSNDFQNYLFILKKFKANREIKDNAV